MSRHINIPIFIPHLGCPNQCVFCNQRSISGVQNFDPDKICNIIDDALSTIDDDDVVEIAFFGGSFTGIDKDLMVDLLKIANNYIQSGQVNSIRCSTRPDYISQEILAILKEYNVKVIELGLQSSSDKVLKISKRGHTANAEIEACKTIVNSGFDLVGQMMIGLPESTLEDEIKTAEFIISSGACGARIYPTVVFKETELCNMTNSGKYVPLTLEEAISRSAKVFRMFMDHGIEVIRIGLCSSENLSSDETYHSGPNHPALGELVVNEYYLERIIEKAKKLSLSANDKLCITVAPGYLSKAIGQKKRNKILLIDKLNVSEIEFHESSLISGYNFEIKKTSGEKGCI